MFCSEVLKPGLKVLFRIIMVVVAHVDIVALVNTRNFLRHCQ